MKKKVYYYSLMPSDSTAFYRSSGVLPYLNNPEFEVVDVSHITKFNWAQFVGVDIFFMQRPFSKEHLELLTLVKDMGSKGMKIILDYDDNLFCISDSNPTYFMYLASQETLAKCIGLADEIWTSTVSIKEAIERLNRNVFIVPNAHNNYLWKEKEKRPFNSHTRKVIYRGGSSHQADVNEVAEELVRVINANQDWTFEIMGDRFNYMESRCGNNYHIVGAMTIMQYFKYFYNSNPTIGIFPLCNTQFNRGKSNISFLEVTYAGGTFFGNKKLPEFNHDGIIDLSQLEVGMTTNFELLKDCNEKSWEYIQDNLLLSKVNEIRTERILANL